MTNLALTQLTILQQTGYLPERFLTWWLKHPFTVYPSSKKPLVVTAKIKLLERLSYLLLVLSLSLSFFTHSLIGFLLTITLFFAFPWVFFLLSILILLPYEKLNLLLTIQNVHDQITLHPHLTTIGITGSFGKTSVKDMLYTLLSGHAPTVKTPESYNTVFGVAKVVRHEILTKTRYFICEMGAYTQGEIAQLCRMVPPDYSILTAIGSQHLERFKSLKNTTLAKFELVDATPGKHALVNLDNDLIRSHLQTDPRYSLCRTYSLHDPQADFYVSRFTFSATGAHFTLKWRGGHADYQTSLFGTSNLYNLVAAISMCHLLKVPQTTIQKRLSLITPSPHRLQTRKVNRSVLIDNAYSSNEQGFLSVIQDLSQMPGRKVLITPGIVELGQATASVHRAIGQMAAPVFSHIYLVGHSERTTNFLAGVRSIDRKLKVTELPNSQNLWPLIDELSTKFDWILLENDLPDNY